MFIEDIYYSIIRIAMIDCQVLKVYTSFQMAIQKQISVDKEIRNDSGFGLGVSLSKLKTPINVSPSNAAPKTSSDDITAYSHDALRSLVVSASAIAIQLALYFSHLIK